MSFIMTADTNLLSQMRMRKTKAKVKRVFQGKPARDKNMSKKTVEEIREEIERRLVDIGEIPLRHHDITQDIEQTVLEQLLYFIDGKEEK